MDVGLLLEVDSAGSTIYGGNKVWAVVLCILGKLVEQVSAYQHVIWKWCVWGDGVWECVCGGGRGCGSVCGRGDGVWECVGGGRCVCVCVGG